MSTTITQQKWTLASTTFHEAYTDFVLSRQAMQCFPATLEFYKYTAGKFLKWLETKGLMHPQEICPAYLAESRTGKEITPLLGVRCGS